MIYWIGLNGWQCNICAAHDYTHSLLLQLDLSLLSVSDTRYIVYAPLVQPLLYQNCDLAPCTITQLSLVYTKKKSMYKNTVIQQKDSVATWTVAGAMAPFSQIRTSQEKRNPCPNRQHLQMAESVCGVFWGACLRCRLNHWLKVT